MKDTKEQIARNLQDLFGMLGEGQFLEAQEKYLHDDVALIEGNSPPKYGKEHNMKLEAEVLENVAEFVGYTVTDHAVNEGVSFYEAVMEYIEKDGNHVRVEQAVASTWSDGKIIKERYYHGNG